MNLKPVFFNLYSFCPVLRAISSRKDPNITKNDICNFKILLPPLPEQKEIADILTSIDKRIEAEETKKAQVEIIKKGLMQQLLTGKMRVKVLFNSRSQKAE